MTVIDAASTATRTWPLGSKVLRVLGTPITVTDLSAALGVLERWVGSGASHYVCVADVHSVMVARSDGRHREVLSEAGMVLPDGMPLVWTGWLRGERGLKRVCGPDFMQAVCADPRARSWRHLFLGGAAGVADAMAERLQSRHPDLQVCGTISPPFRPLSFEEDERLVAEIARMQPDIVWVGLGCPKQERWMCEHVHRLPNCTLIGVGAAFDFHAGRVRRAPRWMQHNGLEWLHRLCSEPARLWRRYLLDAPLFAGLSFWETLRIRMAQSSRPAPDLLAPEAG